MERAILDTSALIALRDHGPTDLPDEPLITAITLAELSVGPLVATSDLERARRQLLLQTAETSFQPLPFDEQAARVFGLVAAELRAGGGTRRARSYDALIAAIALANSLPVYTSNPADFAGISGLKVVPVTA